jgi:REP element-mobilizing transposase RayT
MSRVVDRNHVFGDEEKEFFRLTMRKLEMFTGVRVLAYCVMSNHFHLLAEVPKVAELDDTALLERLRAFYSKARMAVILQEFGRARAHAEATGNDAWLCELREGYLCRMGDLSVFVKELKERFTKWYNRREGRRGTLWEERFKSVLVEDSDTALSTMAAYIELNPVRARLVDDPRDYRYWRYAEAVAGGQRAREGVAALLGMHGQAGSWRSMAAKYRCLLFCAGRESDAKAGIDPLEVRKVLDAGGELKLNELIRCHVRYFNDGVALGSRLFVEEVFAHNRSLFGERRKSGARKMKGGDWNGLFCLRNLTGALAAPG